MKRKHQDLNSVMPESLYPYRHVVAFLSFFLIIALFYIKLPLHNSLPGNYDTWGNLAMFKDLMGQLESFFTGAEKGSFLYPYEHPWKAYGLDFFSGIFWVMFYKAGLNEVWAYWLYISLLLSLNSLGFFVFSKHFIENVVLRFCSSLAFSLHLIVYLNIDTPNALSYFFLFLSLHYLMLFIRENKRRYIISFAVLAAAQIYASPVVFVLLFFMSALIVLVKERHSLLGNVKSYLVAFIIVLALTIPYIFSYLVNNSGHNSLMYIDVDKIFLSRYLSLQWNDFARIHPLHLIYGCESGLDHPLVSLKHAFPGFLISFFALLSILFRKAWMFILISVVLFIIGSGKYIFINEQTYWSNPLGYLFFNVDFYDFFRVPSRVGLALLACFILIAFVSIERVAGLFKYGRQFSLVIALLVVSESGLWSKRVFNSSEVLGSVHPFNDYVRSSTNSHKVVLNIPSGLFSSAKDSREFIYMMNRYHQGGNTLNGSVAYLPQSRLDLWKLLDNVDLNEEAFCSYLYDQHVTDVFLFENFIIDASDQVQVDIVKSCNCLVLDNTIDNIALYKVQYP